MRAAFVPTEVNCVIHVEQYRLLSNLTFDIVPPIILVRVGQIVYPYIKIGTEEVFVWSLANILTDILGRDALLLFDAVVALDFNLL